MNIEITKVIPLEELIGKVRGVPLLSPDENGNRIFPYENANIELRNVSPHEVNPTTFYLLKENLKFQRELRDYLIMGYGTDSLKLNHGLELANVEKGEEWTLIPPIIEVTPRTVRYIPIDGELEYQETARIQIPIINDGAHRCWISLVDNTNFNSIYISGASERFPFYAHPNEWDRIKIVDKTPSTKREKKFYSREKCYFLYRDFGVLGCGAPRHLGKKDG